MWISDNIKFRKYYRQGTGSGGESPGRCQSERHADDITVLTFTDENGVYTLSHLKTEKDAAKIYKLNISKAGYVEQEYEAEVLLGQSTQAENVVLKKDMGSVRGKVMDSNGMPAEGVTIAISGTDTYEV